MNDAASGLLVEILRGTIDISSSRDCRTHLDAIENWPLLLKCLETHGLLLHFRHLINTCGFVLPQSVAENAAKRFAAVESDHHRFCYTVIEVRRLCRSAGIPLIWLKGAALWTEAPDRPLLRTSGDVDLLVRRSDVDHLETLLHQNGFLPPPGSLDSSFTKLFHFHLTVRPVLPFFKPVEVHWHLHAEAHLFLVTAEDLWKRSQPITSEENERRLDLIDEWLHFLTHIDSHWLDARPLVFDQFINELLEQVEPDLRLKWLQDIIVGLELLVVRVEVEEIQKRITEWNAGPVLDRFFALLSSFPGLSGRASEVLHMVCRTKLLPSVKQSAPRVVVPAHKSNLLDFRPAALRRLVPWIWPPARYLSERRRRTGRVTPSGGLVVLRLLHLTSVFRRVSAAMIGLAGGLIRSRRRRNDLEKLRTHAAEPELVLRHAIAFRRLTSGGR